MNVKEWIADATGMKALDDRFLNPPFTPYIVVGVEENRRGDDYTGRGILERNITLDLYSDAIDADAEHKVESAIDGLEVDYSKRRVWIDSEKMYQTVYTFFTIEKERV